MGREMPYTPLSPTSVLLVGMDFDLAATLQQILAGEGHQVSYEGRGASATLRNFQAPGTPDIICCGTRRRAYQRVIEQVRLSGKTVPVVVVSGKQETAEWLDALEAGASDYFAQPFDSGHICWVIESALKAAGAPN
jgi:DNA-binding response OmpR family regulator